MEDHVEFVGLLFGGLEDTIVGVRGCSVVVEDLLFSFSFSFSDGCDSRDDGCCCGVSVVERAVFVAIAVVAPAVATEAVNSFSGLLKFDREDVDTHLLMDSIGSMS